jgi:hypothetical protein
MAADSLIAAPKELALELLMANCPVLAAFVPDWAHAQPANGQNVQNCDGLSPIHPMERK